MCKVGPFLKSAHILLAAKSQQKFDQVKADLGKRFDVKDMGELHYFHGVCMKQNPETGKIWISQQTYTEAIIKKLGMEHSKPACTHQLLQERSY